MSAPRSVGVIGLGNVLMGDDAFGPWVVQVLLAEHDFSEDVAVNDLGTPGLDLMPWVSGLEALILVDTVSAKAPPGTIRSRMKRGRTMLQKALWLQAQEAGLTPAVKNVLTNYGV